MSLTHVFHQLVEEESEEEEEEGEEEDKMIETKEAAEGGMRWKVKSNGIRQKRFSGGDGYNKGEQLTA